MMRKKTRDRLVAVGAFICMVLLVKIYFSGETLVYVDAESLEGECNPGIPCTYAQEVDFRIIVITFNRPDSLLKLLKSLNEVLLDGESGALEIWIDRNSEGKVENKTIHLAKAFNWKGGPTTVHIQKTHVGIYGQWIDTWRPTSLKSRELALILEDDISVSPFIYRWIRAVDKFYGKRKDYAGSTLNSDEQRSHDGKYRQLMAPKEHTAFMYKCIGTWGFTPSPKVWSDFQDWFHVQANKSDFHPYVPDIEPTEWYKNFEKEGRENSMWEMWFIYYAHVERLYTVYNNLVSYNGDNDSCLCINRREIGLHYETKGREDFCKLLRTWKNEFISFPRNYSTARLDWNGLPLINTKLN